MQRAGVTAPGLSIAEMCGCAFFCVPLASRLPAPAAGGDCLAVGWFCAEVVFPARLMAHASLCLVLLGVVVRESSWCTSVHFLQPSGEQACRVRYALAL